ncbi:TetR/AcrR family transcriptional regulator C-terminal domain-containing protein [Pedococcus bigeumensis]|uniref:TetR/AcrR family transcriptional regulator C-terminal domain-containing protein n=1 Tax=Pedococcus bigeumensis TaxID=433644 RepID=UPI0031E13D41
MSPPAPKKPSTRRGFSTEQVAETALRVLDERGAAGLSVRAVATELGINPNALYTYVRSREDLERLVVESVLAEVPPRSNRGTWQSRIRGLCLDVHAALVRHPGAAQLFMNAPMDGPQAMGLGEGLLRELTRAGLSPTQASRAAYTLIVQVIGFSALAMAETDGTVPLTPEAERVAARRAALEHVPADTHPLTAATRDTAAAWVGETQLRWSVDRLLEGFAAQVDAP